MEFTEYIYNNMFVEFKNYYESMTFINDSEKNVLLLQACNVFNSVGIVKFLVENGANVNCISPHGRTPLLQAVSCEDGDNVVVVEFLISNGAEINKEGSMGRPYGKVVPLIEALFYGKNKTCFILIENGANIHYKGFGKNTPLHIALERISNLHIIELLLYKDSCSEINFEGQYPLDVLLDRFRHQSSIYTIKIKKKLFVDIFKLLVKNNAKVSQ